MILLILWSFTC